MRIAFMGLGLMGAGMARRLAGAGFAVCVYNRSREKAEPFADIAQIAKSPFDAAQGADIIISMLAEDTASRACWLGETGALAGARPGAICIESSTVSSGWIKEWAHAVETAACKCLDAPVTGSKLQAEAGELQFVVGGDTQVFEDVRPAFAAMSKASIHLGPIGSGAIFKLINNFLCGVQVASLGEAMVMVERSGLDREKAVQLLCNGAPGSPLVKMLSARMVDDLFAPNFLLRLMAKDIAYASEEGAHLGISPKMAEAAKSLFNGAAAAGYGEEDIAAIVKYLRQVHTYTNDRKE